MEMEDIVSTMILVMPTNSMTNSKLILANRIKRFNSIVRKIWKYQLVMKIVNVNNLIKVSKKSILSRFIKESSLLERYWLKWMKRKMMWRIFTWSMKKRGLWDSRCGNSTKQ